MKKLVLLILLALVVSEAESQGTVTKVRTLLADSVGIRSGGIRRGLLRTDGTNLLLSSTAGMVRFDSKTGFNSGIQFNLPRATEAQQTAWGATTTENVLAYITDADPFQNLQFKSGGIYRAPLHVPVGTDPPDGPLIIRADSVGFLGLGAANRMFGVNAAGTGLEYKNVFAVTLAGGVTVQDLSSVGAGAFGGWVTSGVAGPAGVDGEFVLMNSSNAFRTNIRGLQVVPTGHRTVYAGLLNAAPTEFSIPVTRTDKAYDSDDDLRAMPSGLYVDDAVSDPYFLQPLSEGVQFSFNSGELLVGGNGADEATSIPRSIGGIGVRDSLGTPKMYGKESGFFIDEEWISATPAGNNGWTEYVLGGTADALINNEHQDLSHFGILRLTTGNSASGIAGVNLGYATTTDLPFTFAVNGGSTIWEADIYIETLSDGTDAYDIFAGFSDDGTDVDNSGNGVYFWYNHNASAFWLMAGDSAGANATTATTVTVATGWTKLKMEITTVENGYVGDPGEPRMMVSYYINGVNVGATVTVPALPVTPVFMIKKQLSTVARDLDIDYCVISHFFTTER